MRKFLRKNLYPLTVFTTGACVLVIEVVAVRALSPYFGNTIFTFSSVISVILAALSIGYYAGGKLADKRPSETIFFGTIFVSGVLLISLHALGVILLPILSEALSLSMGPLVSAVILFLVPAILLGTLSPYAVKLHSMENVDDGIGTVSGTIFFWGTFGSILGSLAAGFVLIPRFGIDSIFIATSAVLCLIGLVALLYLGMQKRKVVPPVVVVLLSVAFSLSIVDSVNSSYLFVQDGVYEKVRVYDKEIDGRMVRYFMQDRAIGGGKYINEESIDDHLFEYSKYYSLYKIFTPEMSEALVIGGGAYTVPRVLLAELPEVEVDVSEIEPALIDIAKEYFDLQTSPRLHNYIEDGRRFLRDSPKQYELIFSDVFYSLYSIPSHFTTKEFFTVAKGKLAKDGVFVANMIGHLSRQEPSLIMTEIKTFKTVFPNSYFFASESPASVGVQNIMFVAFNNDEDVDFDKVALRFPENEFFETLSERLIDTDRYEFSPYIILTDNYTPVDHYTSKVLSKLTEEKTGLVDGGEVIALSDQISRQNSSYTHSSDQFSLMKQFLLSESAVLGDEVIVQQVKENSPFNLVLRFDTDITDRVAILIPYNDAQSFVEDGSDVEGNNTDSVALAVELSRAIRLEDDLADVGIDIIFLDNSEDTSSESLETELRTTLGGNYFFSNLHELYSRSTLKNGLYLENVCFSNPKTIIQNDTGEYSFSPIDAFPSFPSNETEEECTASRLESVAEQILNHLELLEV